MRRLGILKAERLVDLLNGFGIPVALIYVAAMIFWPWVEGRGSWIYVQNVWDRWQGLNVGMLAFISSVVAFNISRFNANKQREREFAASKAFLPSALSELTSYFKLSAQFYLRDWEAPGEAKPGFVIPEPPHGYKEIFANCIRHAEPEVGDYLSRMLVLIQIHDARLQDYISDGVGMEETSAQRANLIVYLYRVTELQALVGKLFDFARGESEFDPRDLEWKDFRNAFGGLNIWPDEIKFDDDNDLVAFTQRAIARNAKKNT